MTAELTVHTFSYIFYIVFITEC